MKMLDYVDLVQNELRNGRIQNLASAPSSPVEGQVYWDTTLHQFGAYNGTTWVYFGSGSGDFSSNTSSSVDSEVVLFSGTGGKTGKRATGTGIAKLTSGVLSTATSGTDYAPATSGTSILKGSGSGGFSNATSGTDYAPATATTSALKGNGSGGFSAATLNDVGSATADYSLNSHKLTNVTDPTSAQDAATKAYVDAAAAGIDWKASVRVATTAAGTLASSFENGDAVDGVTLATGNRILIKNQSSGSENGIYTVNASGAPTRATDADANAEVTGGLAVFVEEGTTNADSGWLLTNDGAVTVGSTALVFTQFTSLGQITAGAALTKTGSTLDVAVDSTTIEVSSDALRIAATAAGAGLTGGGASALAVGAGTGITVAADTVSVDTTVVARMYKGALTGGATSEVVTHGLGTRDVHVQVINNATPWDAVFVTWEATSTNTVTIRSGANLPASYRVVIMG